MTGVHGTWTYAQPDLAGPVLVGACYPSYHSFAFDDPDGDGRIVTLDVGYVQGGGAYMPSDSEHLVGGLDPESGQWVFDGMRTPASSPFAGPASEGEQPVRYLLKLDKANQRLTGTRSVDGGPVEPITLGPFGRAPAPAEGCGPPPP